MEFILFSYPTNFKEETTIVNFFFENGLTCLHLRKPFNTVEEVSQYLNEIDKKYHNRIVLHQFHSLVDRFKLKGLHFKSKQTTVKPSDKALSLSKAFHSVEQIINDCKNLDYCTLSPVFDSISKIGYEGLVKKGDLNLEECKSINKKLKIIALGGITPENIPTVKKMGFDGVGILGFVWNNAVLDKSIEKTKTIFFKIAEAINTSKNEKTS